MATYVPNAQTLSEPTGSRPVGSAAEEFRVLKSSLDSRADALESSVTTINGSLSQAQTDVAVLQTQLAAIGLGTDSVALAANLASSGAGKGAALIGMNDAANMFAALTVEAALSEIGSRLGQRVDVTAFPWLADSTGATSASLAVEAAAATLQDGDELWFPPGGTYLFDYPWAPFSDSDPVDLSGRCKAIIYIVNKKRITIRGNGCKIVTINHPVDTKGGLLFALFKRAPNCRVTGFEFDMSFTGMNTLSTRYPLCGGVMSFDKYAGAGTQATLCSNFEADNLNFKLFHPQAAFSITASPYGSDNNNGHKLISVFASGDSAATAYSEQSRRLRMHDIRFLEGHNGYGCWGVAFNDAKFWNISADAWVGASYTQASATYTGANFVSPVRFYQYYCRGFETHGVHMVSLPVAARVGAFSGVAGGVHFDSGLSGASSVSTGGGKIHSCSFVLDCATATLPGVFDAGIYSSASGAIRIIDNEFDAHQIAGVVPIFLLGNDGAPGSADYVISGNQSSSRINGPAVEIVNQGTTGDGDRAIRSVTVTGNQFLGWGGEGAVYTYRSGLTYYGVETLTVTGNIFDARSSISPAQAINAQGRTAGDYVIATDNAIKGASAPISTGSATTVIRDNQTVGATANGNVSYLTNALQGAATFTAGQAVTISGIAVGELYEYSIIEINSTAGVAFMVNNLANSGSGTLRTVAAGNTAYLRYKKVTSQR